MRLTKDEKLIIQICRQLNVECCGLDIDEGEGLQTYLFQEIWDYCPNTFTVEKCKGVIGSLVKKGILEVDYPDETRIEAGCPSTEYLFNEKSEWFKNLIEKGE